MKQLAGFVALFLALSPLVSLAEASPKGDVAMVLGWIDDICGSGDEKGSRVTFEVQGGTKAWVLKALRWVGGEIAGEAKFSSTEVEGIIGDVHRAMDREKARTCRMRYFDQLYPKLLQVQFTLPRSPDLKGTRVFMVSCGDAKRTDAVRQEILRLGAHFEYEAERCHWSGGGVGFNVVHFIRSNHESEARIIAQILERYGIQDHIVRYNRPEFEYDILIGLCDNEASTRDAPTVDRIDCKK